MSKSTWETYKNQHSGLSELLKKGRKAKVQNAMELLSTKQVLKKIVKFEQVNPKTGKLKLVWQKTEIQEVLPNATMTIFRAKKEMSELYGDKIEDIMTQKEAERTQDNIAEAIRQAVKDAKDRQS